MKLSGARFRPSRLGGQCHVNGFAVLNHIFHIKHIGNPDTRSATGNLASALLVGPRCLAAYPSLLTPAALNHAIESIHVSGHQVPRQSK